jgi:hypothetical protein
VSALRDGLQAYAAHRLPEAEAVVIETLERIFGGASRETYRFVLAYRTGATTHRRRLILRRDRDGRPLVLMTHNTDIADGWEREGEDRDFFYTFSPESYALGINIILYSMSH